MKKILSLDGGGIRGAATVEYLKMIEANEKKLIGGLFDMFAGTSTGAIIAGAIGVCGMGAEEVAGLYNYENSNIIMNQDFWDRKLGLVQNKPKYDGVGKRKVIDSYFGQKEFGEAKKPVIIPAYDVEKRKLKVFKSFKHSGTLAADIVDASSAAPCYFPTVKISQDYYIDGGVVANNPAMCAYAEARSMWPNEEIKMLSVGTGITTRKINGEESKGYGCIEWAMHDLMGIVMDESAVHYQAKQILGQYYIRVNSVLDKVNDDMDDCSRGNLRALKDLAQKWFENSAESVSWLLS